MKWIVLGTLAVALSACNCGGGNLHYVAPDSGVDAGPRRDAGVNNCTNPGATDLEGCACNRIGQQRSCYPTNVPAQTRGVGACSDGIQTCQSVGETIEFGPCQGAATPTSEVCNDGVDNDCNGETDCSDIACYSYPNCNTNCTNNTTRPCYTGPSNTRNHGQCHDGIQTCIGNTWTGCNEETLPSPETCTDALDHNCNGFAGCYDPACFANAACQSSGSCDAGVPYAGCVCPTGDGDSATCPAHMYLYEDNFGSLEACCPCTANNCDQAVCCGETACQGKSQCAGLTCHPLPAACNGQVNADCDFESSDNTEDCDEPCCPCSPCTCGVPGTSCQHDSDCCLNSCSNGTCDYEGG